MNIRLILRILVFISCSWSGFAAADSYDDMIAAIKLNDTAAVEALLVKGMDVNTTDPGANTLLMLAIQNESADMAGLLLRRKAQVDARNKYGETALMLAAAKGDLELAKLLLDHGAKINLTGWNPLIYAAWRGQDEMVKYLLDKGADIDAVSPNGVSALMMAVRGEHAATVKLLLWEVANPNIKSDSGATAMAWALKVGNTDIVNLLKQAGAKE